MHAEHSRLYALVMDSQLDLVTVLYKELIFRCGVGYIISEVTVTYCEVLSHYVPVQKFLCTGYGRSFTLAGL